MAGSSTAEPRLRPTREDDLEYVVAAEAEPDKGILRDALYHGGRFECLVVMSIPRPEWTG